MEVCSGWCDSDRESFLMSKWRTMVQKESSRASLLLHASKGHSCYPHLQVRVLPFCDCLPPTSCVCAVKVLEERMWF